MTLEQPAPATMPPRAADPFGRAQVRRRERQLTVI